MLRHTLVNGSEFKSDKKKQNETFCWAVQLPIVSKAISLLPPPKHDHYKLHLPPLTIRIVSSPPFQAAVGMKMAQER
jgi:hypothetical protein